MEVIEIDNSAKHSIVFHGKLKENREKLCDVHLKVQDTLIPAHKIILASNSDYFQNMFAGTVAFGDSTNSVIAIEPEFSLDSIKSIVNYIYTGKLSFILENATNLLKAADFYGIDFIKESCRDILVLNVTEENRIKTWCLFEQMNCHTEDVDKLISENINPVLNHPNFLSLSGQFVVKFFKNILKCMPKNSAEEIYLAMIKWIKYDEARKPFCTELIKLFPLEYLKTISKHLRSEKLIQENIDLIRWLFNAKLDGKNKDRSYSIFIMESDAANCYIINLETRKFKNFQSPIKVTRFTLTTINSRIFVIGGKLKNGEYSKVCHIFDPTTDTWSTIPFLHEIAYYKSCHLNGKIYLLGKKDKKIEIISFDVEKQTTTKLPDVAFEHDFFNIYVSDDSLRLIYCSQSGNTVLRVWIDKLDLVKNSRQNLSTYELSFHSLNPLQFHSCFGIINSLARPLSHYVKGNFMAHYNLIQNYINSYKSIYQSPSFSTFSSMLKMNSNTYGICKAGIYRLNTEYTWDNILKCNFEGARITSLQ